MDYQLFNDLSVSAYNELTSGNIKKAIDNMQSMLYLCPNPELEEKMNALSRALEGLLNCIRNGIQDENREDSFQQMKTTGWLILTSINRWAKINYPSHIFNKIYYSNIRKSYSTYTSQLKSPVTTPLEAELHDSFSIQLFNQIWLSQQLSKEEAREIEELINSSDIQLADKLMTISAIMLCCLESPDPQKFSILTKCCYSEIPEIQIRALVGMFSLSLSFDNCFFFPQEMKAFSDYFSDPEHQDKLCTIVHWFYETKDVPEFTKKFNDQFMPRLHRENEKGRELMGKMNDPESMEEIEKLQGKMQESSRIMGKLYQNGKDVYYGSFRNYKKSAFFKEAANWFYPFSKTRFESFAQFSNDKKPLVGHILDICNFCDNDKWSFFFLMKNMQATINIAEGSVDLGSLMEQKKPTWADTCRNYIWDLYRFYNLFGYRHQFINIFGHTTFSPFHCPQIRKQLDTKHTLAIAQIMADHNDGNYALKYIEHLPDQDYHIMLLKAVCYSQANLSAQAIKFYEDCLKEKNNLKVKKQLLNCLKKSHMWAKASDILKELAIDDPKNEIKYLHQQAEYLIKGNKESEALDLLYKIIYLQPNDQQSIRAIVWCNLKIREPQKALRYWDKISEKKAEDWLNKGHIHWAMLQEGEAFTCYNKYFELMPDKDKAKSLFLEDAKMLITYGIDKISISLMLQAIGV